MDGWKMRVPEARAVLQKTGSEQQQLSKDRAALRSEVDHMRGVLNEGDIPAALAELWNGSLGTACQSVEARTANACRALDAMIANYDAADQKMAAEAECKANFVDAAMGSAMSPFDEALVKDKF